MILDFKEAAGFNTTSATFDSKWAKALFDMSAFKLVSGGNANTREMQKTLNRKYSEWTGILPCDGIYQRATNTALIYGIQVELGLGGIANGNFGPSTQVTYESFANSGIQNYPDLVLLVQYGLYQNVKDLNLGTFSFSSHLDSATASVLAGFQQFMKLSGVQSGYPDLRTMMSLALSNGDADRPCSGCDTSYQLTQAQINTLKANGFTTVGRYLTGTAGSEFRPKALSRDECLLLFDNGMKIFAIFQDSLYIPKPFHFNSARGMSDARKAITAAKSLGIPLGETLYFAIDVDCQDWEIEEYVLPYFMEISNQLSGSGYNYGVYGTRNVCQSVENTISGNPPQGMFVSNMSSGFSGNLGFPQPQNWSFDQFFEYPNGIGSGTGFVEVDKVAVSGNDNGFSSISPDEDKINLYTSFAYSLGVGSFIDEVAGGSIQADVEYTIPFVFPNVQMKVVFHNELTNTGNFTMVYDIENSELSSQASADFESILGEGVATTSLVATVDELVAGIKTGQIAIEMGIDATGSYEINLVINSEEFDFDGGVYQASASISFKINPNSFSNQIQEAIESLGEIVTPEAVTGIALIGITALVIYLFSIPTSVIVAMASGLVAFGVFLKDVQNQLV